MKVRIDPGTMIRDQCNIRAGELRRSENSGQAARMGGGKGLILAAVRREELRRRGQGAGEGQRIRGATTSPPGTPSSGNREKRRRTQRTTPPWKKAKKAPGRR